MSEPTAEEIADHIEAGGVYEWSNDEVRWERGSRSAYSMRTGGRNEGRHYRIVPLAMERNHDNSRVPPDAIGEVDGGYVTTLDRVASDARYSTGPGGSLVSGRFSDLSDYLVWVPVDPPKPVMVEIEADLLEKLAFDARDFHDEDPNFTLRCSVQEIALIRSAIGIARAEAAGR
jgi:hypothetical protein